MDSLLDVYEDTGEVDRPRRQPVEPPDAEQAEALIATGTRGGRELLGGNGLLK
jgi:hypothetical protein